MTVISEPDARAIEAVVQLYVDGASNGIVEKLREAFHEQAWTFGSIGGRRYDLPADELISMVARHPLDSDGSYAARITSIEQTGDAAVVRVEERGRWGGLSFVDYFSLANVDGTWRIVGLTFAQTGGELAQRR